jgi:hypothetical protein
VITVNPKKLMIKGLVSQKLAPFLWRYPKIEFEPTSYPQKSSYATIDPQEISKKDSNRLQ